MSASYSIHGHAIVSADDRIADRTGRTPAALRHEADWRRFQEALDRAAVIVLGRHGHSANPNPKKRNRLVLSSTARGVEKRPDGWWWNPREAGLAEALSRSAPQGGTVAVTGGRMVFDLFLEAGFDGFDLARMRNIRLADGVPIFSAVTPERGADAILADSGLLPARDWLDLPAQLEMTLWRRP